MADKASVPATVHGTKEWKEYLEKYKADISNALPKVGLTPERVVRIAFTAMRQNPQLFNCEAKSVVGSLIQASELGLTVSPTKGHAYLVPFRNNKKGILECTLIVGYKGYQELALRSGKVDPIQAWIVYEKEPFEILAGSFPMVKHVPLPPDKRGEKKIGVYAVAPMKGGSSTFAFLWTDEVNAIRKMSKAGNEGPWVTNEDEMWKKTAVRRIAKQLPLSDEFAKAATIDEYNETTSKFMGEQLGEEFAPDLEPEDIRATVVEKTASKGQGVISDGSKT